ncbi:MAG: fibronectin type III domain-containing protein, partial [Candidatus Micrarchaeota archaeon]
MKQIIFVLLALLMLPSFTQALTSLTTCSTLSQSGETYRLMNDISINSGNCFTLSGNNVVLDLNGKTITLSGSGRAVTISSPTGANNVVMNGKIIASSDLTYSSGIGMVTIGIPGTPSSSTGTIHDVTMVGYDMDVMIQIGGSGVTADIYNNNITRIGTYADNSHSNVGAIDMYGYSPSATSMIKIHNNVISGRAWLINAKGRVNIYNNFLYPLKYGRNPYGIRFIGVIGGIVNNNVMISTNSRGMLVEEPSNNVVISNNNFDIAEAPLAGVDGSGVHALRIRSNGAPANNFSIYGNTIIGRILAGSGAITGEGAFIGVISNFDIHDNIFGLYADYQPSGGGGALTLEGNIDKSIRIYNNILKSNFEPIRLGHLNSDTSNGILDSLTIVKETTPVQLTFHSISSQSDRSATNITIRNFTFLNGAQKSDIKIGYGPTETYSYTFEWYLTIRALDSAFNPINGVQVTVTNSLGNLYSGTTGPDGKLNNLGLKEFTAVKGLATTQFSPYTVAVTYGGSTQTRSVTLDSTKTETFVFGGVADTIAPSTISNLAASIPTASSIRLTWTATGDDTSSGTSSQYDIRYSTSSITSTNFNSANQVTGEPTPFASGSTQSMTINGLNPSTTYYFAIKAG